MTPRRNWYSLDGATSLIFGAILLAACVDVANTPIAQRRKREAVPLIKALEHYHAAYGSYPDSLTELRPVDIAGPDSAQTAAIIKRAGDRYHSLGATPEDIRAAIDTAPFTYNGPHAPYKGPHSARSRQRRSTTYELGFVWGLGGDCTYKPEHPKWVCPFPM
jgi:hypothetical protein